jgi:hypothetical protein
MNAFLLDHRHLLNPMHSVRAVLCRPRWDSDAIIATTYKSCVLYLQLAVTSHIYCLLEVIRTTYRYHPRTYKGLGVLFLFLFYSIRKLERCLSGMYRQEARHGPNVYASGVENMLFLGKSLSIDRCMMALSHHIFMQSSYSSLQLCELSTYAYMIYLFSFPSQAPSCMHFSLLQYVYSRSLVYGGDIYKKN